MIAGDEPTTFMLLGSARRPNTVDAPLRVLAFVRVDTADEAYKPATAFFFAEGWVEVGFTSAAQVSADQVATFGPDAAGAYTECLRNGVGGMAVLPTPGG